MINMNNNINNVVNMKILQISYMENLVSILLYEMIKEVNKISY